MVTSDQIFGEASDANARGAYTSGTLGPIVEHVSGTMINSTTWSDARAGYLDNLRTYASGDQTFIGSTISEVSTNSDTYVKVKEIQVLQTGQFSVTYYTKTSNAGDDATSQIYRNGTATGAIQTHGGDTYTLKGLVANGFRRGDLLQIYAHRASSATAYVSGVLVYGTTTTNPSITIT